MSCTVMNIPAADLIIRYVILTALIVVCNMVVLYIWLKPSNRSALTVFLALIALFDILSMICATAASIIEHVNWDRIQDVSLCVTLLVFNTISDMFHSCSVMITTFVAIQRFVVCAFPFKGREYCNKRIRGVLLFGCLALPVIFAVPNLYGIHDMGIWTYNTVKLGRLDKNESTDYSLISVCPTSISSHNLTSATERKGNLSLPFDHFLSECFWNPEFCTKELTSICATPTMLSDRRQRAAKIIHMAFIHIIPTIIITFCMGYCMYTLRSKTIKGSTSSNSLFCQKRKTLLLVLVMFSILTSEIPSTVAEILKLVYGKSADIWLLSTDGEAFCELFTATSYLHNVIIYTAMCKQFRQTFLELCCCRKIRSMRQS